ncbi:MAG: nucleoside monophosphate kinase [Puniceicoccales bacterium]|nr:nucleoside monophosphate kinase [Puniceicoccales bacterium]
MAPWVLAGVSREAYEDFESFWQEFEAEPHGGNFAIPKKVIWLNGAPGAGKGTNTAYVRDVFQIRAEPIVTSDLLDSPAFQKAKDAGQLIGDREVTALVFRTLLSRPYAGGAIVDGYPRTAVQAECAKLLHDKIVAMKQSSDFHLVLLEVSEKMSVDRQLGRGVRAKRNNERAQATRNGKEMPVRQTDMDPAAARRRYRTYVEQTTAAMDVLGKYFPCHRVNAEGSFDRVRANVYAIGRSGR